MGFNNVCNVNLLMRFYKNVLICFFCLPAILSSGQQELLRKEIEKIIKYEQSIDFNVVPGVLIGIIDGDSTFTFAFGYNINPGGIYEMGSLTKPFVAWIANETLEGLGQNRFTRICEHLPDSICNDLWRAITYDHVIEHKSGLMRIAPGIGEIESDVTDPYKDYSIELLGRDLKAMQPVPGRYSYSHMGYAATHWLFEHAGGIQSLTEKYLTGPFGMPDTRWHHPDRNIAQGHGLDGRPQPAWNTNALMPALGLKSSLNDLITFVKILFAGYESNRRTDPGGLKRELKALSKMGAYKVVDGWFVIRSAKSLVYYHNGRTGGHHVSIAFTPHLRKAVIIISNGAMGSNDLSLLILRMVNNAKRPRK